MQQNILRIFAMFQAQTELLRQIATLEASNAQLNAMVEMSLHRRDEHSRYFDSNSSLEQKNKREEKLRLLHDAVKRNAEEIDKLMKEVVSAPSAVG